MSAQRSRRISMGGTQRRERSLPDGSQIPERTLCLVLDLKRPGNHRRVSTSQVEVDADRDVVRVSKQLLSAPELLAIEHFDAKIRRYVNSFCLPSLLRGGVFLLPLGLVERVDLRLEELHTERSALVETFLATYPDLVTAARAQLRGLFNPDDYPEVSSMGAAFSFSWRYVSFRVPETLAAIDRSIFAREREKASRQWSEAAGIIQNLLRANMAELVSHMTDRLTPASDGKPKVFRNTAVSNLTEFLKTFEARNVTDDRELTAIVDRARQLLDGVEPENLRRSDDIRETVRSGFAEINRSLDSMITNRPARRIVLAAPIAQAKEAEGNQIQPASAFVAVTH